MSAPLRVPSAGPACAAPAGWSRDRILFLLAGTVTLTGVLLTATVSPWFLLIPALVGANQLLIVTRVWCSRLAAAGPRRCRRVSASRVESRVVM